VQRDVKLCHRHIFGRADFRLRDRRWQWRLDVKD